MEKRLKFLWLLVLLLLIAACDDEDADTDVTPVVSGVDGEQVLDQAADRLTALDNFTATSTISGAREGSGLCVYQQPNVTYCAVESASSAEEGPASEIYQGRRVWVRSEATGGSWTQARTTILGYEGIVLSDVGATVESIEETDLDNSPAYELNVSLDLEKTVQLMLNDESAAQVLSSANEQTSAAGSVWVDIQTGLPLEDVVTLRLGDQFELTWMMDYGDFDEAPPAPTPLGEQMLRLLDSYSEYMRAGDVDAALALFPEENEGLLRAELQALTEPPFDTLLAPYDSLTLESLVETSDNNLTGQGRIAYSDGVAGTFTVTMIRLEDSWKLFDVQLTREQESATETDSALTATIAEILDEFMVLAEDEAYEAMRELFSRRVQAGVTAEALEAFTDTVYDDWYAGYESLEIDQLQEANVVTTETDQVRGEFLSVQGRMLYEDGRENEFDALLEREDGEWTIANIFISP